MKIQDILTESQLDVAEGWKTGALIGGTLGGAVGGAPGAIAGSAIGAMLQQDWRDRAKADKKRHYEQRKAEKWASNKLKNLRSHIGQMIDRLEDIPKNQMSIKQERLLSNLTKMDFLISEEPVESFNYLRNVDISSENFAKIVADFVAALWPWYGSDSGHHRLRPKEIEDLVNQLIKSGKTHA